MKSSFQYLESGLCVECCCTLKGKSIHSCTHSCGIEGQIHDVKNIRSINTTDRISVLKKIDYTLLSSYLHSYLYLTCTYLNLQKPNTACYLDLLVLLNNFSSPEYGVLSELL